MSFFFLSGSSDVEMTVGVSYGLLGVVRAQDLVVKIDHRVRLFSGLLPCILSFG